MTEKKLIEFAELVKPLHEWLQENFCPHDSIIIKQDIAIVVSEQLGVPLEVRG